MKKKMWNKNLNFNEIFRESVGNIIYPEIPICKKGSIHLVRDIRIKSTNSSPRLKTETGTSPSYLGDEMKLLSVLYRSFVYLSLGLVLGSLGSSGFAGLVSRRRWLRKHFFAGSVPASYDPLVDGGSVYGFLSGDSAWFHVLMAWCDGWDLDLFDWCSPMIWNQGIMVYEGWVMILIVWMGALFLDEVLISRLMLSGDNMQSWWSGEFG